jgi:2,3-dihydroxyphenylpropionate 1,2-dioxygenase
MKKQEAGVVGGAIVSHAPQFLSLPPTEDLAQVARVRQAMQQVGDGIRALKPDVVVVISNAHGEDFSINCVPAFTVYCGSQGNGFDKHKGPWNLRGEVGIELVRTLLDERFDPAYTLDAALGTPLTIPLDYCGFPREFAFLPILVNVYCPPLPKPERCFEFGKALHRSFQRMGLRAAILASGGLSHYPATPMYPKPDVETDKVIYERLKEGNFHYLMAFDEKRLDVTGNIECRSAQILVGALGQERVPDIAAFEPSWHHVYAVLGWTKPHVHEEYIPYYPAIATEHVPLARAVYALIVEPGSRELFNRDARMLAARFNLSAEQTSAFISLDQDVLRQKFSINPIMLYWAKLKLGIKQRETGTVS